MSGRASQSQKVSEHIQANRALLQEKLFELNQLQNEWRAQEAHYNQQTESLVSELRDIEIEHSKRVSSEMKNHIRLIDDLITGHQGTVVELQEEIDACLSTSQDSEADDYDEVIKNLKAQIAEIDENAEAEEPPGVGGVDTDDVLAQLESALTEKQTLFETLLAEANANGQEATELLREIAVRQEKLDRQHDTEVDELVKELNIVDEEYLSKSETLKQEMNDAKIQVRSLLARASVKLGEFQRVIASCQEKHKAKMEDLLDKGRELKEELDRLSSRLLQHGNEALRNVELINRERTRHSTRMIELQVLKNELLREKIDLETTMRSLMRKETKVMMEDLHSMSNLGA